MKPPESPATFGEEHLLSSAKILRVDVKRVRPATDKDIARWIAEDPDTAFELLRAKLLSDP